MVIENFPFTESVAIVTSVFNLIPFPKKLFSLTPKPIEFPDVPTPAEALSSPVGCSWTVMLIILDFISSRLIISLSTVLKKPRPCKLLNDLLTNI